MGRPHCRGRKRPLRVATSVQVGLDRVRGDCPTTGAGATRVQEPLVSESSARQAAGRHGRRSVGYSVNHSPNQFLARREARSGKASERRNLRVMALVRAPRPTTVLSLSRTRPSPPHTYEPHRAGPISSRL